MNRFALWGGGMFVVVMLIVWFLAQQPDEVHAWFEDLATVHPQPVAPPPPPLPPPPVKRSGPCLGLTWTLLAQDELVARVGPDAKSNAQRGDTACEVELSVLCFNGRQVAATPPVAGTSLVSRAAADSLCAMKFGDGWRMSSGGAASAQGELPAGVRFWVAADGAAANPWD